MRVSIDISLGNEAMRTYGDVADLLWVIADALVYGRKSVYKDNNTLLRDKNGNRIGVFSVYKK